MALNADCRLSEGDWDFVKKLTRVASVRVLTSQVCLTFFSDSNNTGTDTKQKLVFPSNWSLQYTGIVHSKYESSHAVAMTWEVLPT